MTQKQAVEDKKHKKEKEVGTFNPPDKLSFIDVVKNFVWFLFPYLEKEFTTLKQLALDKGVVIKAADEKEVILEDKKCVRN